MRFASLGSGSAGNALVAEAGGTTVLLDCGFSLRETAARLTRLGLEIERISAILVTHEHEDHAGGVFRLAARHRIPVCITHGTLAALPPAPEGIELRIIDSHASFSIGALEIHPYPVPHDAREPVQYVFSDGAKRLGVLTDAGMGTPHIEAMLSGCDALVLECNHDQEMLTAGGYPWHLKQRIMSRLGHLENACTAGILSRLDNSRLQHILAAHLSTQNNRPELARNALAGALGCSGEWIGIADQEEGFAWRQII